MADDGTNKDLTLRDASSIETSSEGFEDARLVQQISSILTDLLDMPNLIFINKPKKPVVNVSKYPHIQEEYNQEVEDHGKLINAIRTNFQLISKGLTPSETIDAQYLKERFAEQNSKGLFWTRIDGISKTTGIYINVRSILENEGDIEISISRHYNDGDLSSFFPVGINDIKFSAANGWYGITQDKHQVTFSNQQKIQISELLSRFHDILNIQKESI